MFIIVTIPTLSSKGNNEKLTEHVSNNDVIMNIETKGTLIFNIIKRDLEFWGIY